MNATNQVWSIWNTVKAYTVGEPQTFWAMVQAVGLVVTLWFILRQIQLQRISNSIVALSEIENNWKSPEMVAARAEICGNFVANRKLRGQSWEQVACFFELLGVYCERKMFDPQVIWELYSHQLEHYWPMIKPGIGEMRKADSTAYTHFERLFEQMREISEKRDAPSDCKSHEAVLEFAKLELEKE